MMSFLRRQIANAEANFGGQKGNM